MPERSKPSAPIFTPGVQIAIVLVLLLAAFVAGDLLARRGQTPQQAAQSEQTAQAPALRPSNTLVPTQAATATPIPSPTPRIISSQQILSSIEGSKKLETIVFQIDVLTRASSPNTIGLYDWQFTIGEKRYLFFIEGKVTAGVDLAKLSERDIRVDNASHTVTIQMPPAEILHAYVEDYTIEDYEGAPGTNLDARLIQDALESSKGQIVQKACDSEIIEHASVRAQLLFENMFGFVEAMDYKLVVKPASVDIACQFADVQLQVTPTVALP